MKKFNITLILVLSINLINAQHPLVKQWDYRFGGTGLDWLLSFQQTTDGGYILGGRSDSGISGEKTEPSWGGTDYWIIKIDSLGNKQWDKDFGGANGDGLNSIQQTNDGGYILGGNSNSNISGDKTQDNWDPTQLSSDYWIVKIDSAGNKQWDKTFGGTLNDGLSTAKQTTDGGYILAGWSNSPLSGDKTQSNWSTYYDYWIVKTDSLGNKQWDKRFGGIEVDRCYALELTCDGGYIIGGESGSEISGDRTESNWDTSAHTSDYWIVKLDYNGNKLWDKRYGGTWGDILCSIKQTSDNGFILGGHSVSDAGGDKSQSSWGNHSHDFWIVKTDSLGNKQWDKDFGGTKNEDEFGEISQTCDGGYLIPGTSYSDIGGDKTESNMAFEQSWIVKTDSLGNKQWDKTLLTNVNEDECGFAIQISNGDYVMANSTGGGIAGDKSQPCWGFQDYWIIKFTDTTYVPCTPLTPCNSTVGISTNYFTPELLIYPNPFYSDISLSIKRQNLKQATFIIRNILGQTIFRKEENNLSNTYTKTIDLNKLANGIYLLDVIIDGERTVKKIVKQ